MRTPGWSKASENERTSCPEQAATQEACWVRRVFLGRRNTHIDLLTADKKHETDLGTDTAKSNLMKLSFIKVAYRGRSDPKTAASPKPT